MTLNANCIAEVQCIVYRCLIEGGKSRRERESVHAFVHVCMLADCILPRYDRQGFGFMTLPK